MNPDSATTRLNKFISETGICSRREADRLIEQGRVKVNGEVAGMGVKVSQADTVLVNGKPLRAKPKAVYLVYNKPIGITCTTDSAVPENIVDAVNYKARIFPIGRLDKPSSGLILLTNDGDIVNKILRAGNAHEKEYIVSMDKPITADFVARMAAGVPILDTVTKPCKVKKIGPKTINIILTQGLNRQIRRMAEYLGFSVTSLKRVRIMNIELGELKPGQWRYVSRTELALINSMIGDSSSTEEASILEQPKAARRGPLVRNAAPKAAAKQPPSRANRKQGAGARKAAKPGERSRVGKGKGTSQNARSKKGPQSSQGSLPKSQRKTR
ncbi:23S rRNA pseudouridine(2604) synthase RluF [Oceanisphaera pacifica]|uniref:Pseudouridine synthase n=1 Tax=Oceanisphaera pacifica TaxID=2818389 RepID=A0ABS3NDB6_9GAMM|nr:23S rRNA pseudouridine(2604) synthase RluF [Oceanisphaera pacifica]MBO1518530.1 23S rRNA pseudouridine(2604) synthase RluF [Oceanisphaera pacifica]